MQVSSRLIANIREKEDEESEDDSLAQLHQQLRKLEKREERLEAKATQARLKEEISKRELTAQNVGPH